MMDWTARLRRAALWGLALLCWGGEPRSPLEAAEMLPLRWVVQDSEGADLPCRIHVWNERGQPQRAAGLPFWHDHFVCGGRVELPLPRGQYRYLIERGPEYERREGEVQLTGDDTGELRLNLPRLTDLRRRGWYAADLHVHRPIEDIELLMQAEDLDLVPVITWWNTRNRWAERDLPTSLWQRTADGRFLNLTAGEDEREGGALLYFGLREPLDIATSDREFPSPLTYVDQARERQPDVWIDIEKPFWWDVPLWLASGKMQSIGLANNHMCRDQMLSNEAWGRPRDVQRLPDPLGNGWWSQEIYYQLLNAGFRIPPSAGSASGVLPNPVGYNRVYVRLDGPLTPDAWWQGLRRGECFVTNGPLLLCEANGSRPGHEFRQTADGGLPLNLRIELISRDPIERLEVIHNGRVIHRLAVGTAFRQQLACDLVLEDHGWFLVRAVADNQQTFRFASTGPFYVDRAGQARRVSRVAVKFFQEWADARWQRVRQNLRDPQQREAVVRHHEDARRFWSQRLADATTE